LLEADYTVLSTKSTTAFVYLFDYLYKGAVLAVPADHAATGADPCRIMQESLMQRCVRALRCSAVILLFAAACYTVLAVAEARPGGMNAKTLLSALRDSGLEPRQVDRITQAFFTVPATVYQIRGGELQVYEFPNEKRVAREAETVSADGVSVGTSKVLWMAPPHFFRTGALLVLYLGSDEQVLDILRAKIGPQFAGQ
jgi:hypothetical protein